MRIRARSWLVFLALAAVTSGCRTPPPDDSRALTTTVALESKAYQAEQKLPAAPDWAGSGDCLDQLILLRDMAAQGRLEEAHAPP